jgi:hypothetical protein
MNLQAFKNRTGLIILISIIAALLMYSVDVFKLTYRMTNWKEFGSSPVTPAHIQYFVADTPNLIGFKEDGSGASVTCAVTVAYMETEAGKTARCCDTDDHIACMAGNFSTEFPVPEETCSNSMRELLGIPASLAGAKDFQVFGNCSGDADTEVTITQIDSTGNILWKYINVYLLTVVNSALKCVLVPALLGLAGWLIFSTLRGKKYQPLRR